MRLSPSCQQLSPEKKQSYSTTCEKTARAVSVQGLDVFSAPERLALRGRGQRFI